MNKPKLTYIYGAGHCGSTLLTLLLNDHPDVLALGELQQIEMRASYSDRISDELRHPFWRDVAQRIYSRSGRFPDSLSIRAPAGSIRKILFPSKNTLDFWSDDNRLLVSAIQNSAGDKHLIDSSKQWRRLFLLATSDIFDLRVVNLVRDGRAVTNSYYKITREFDRSVNAWATATLYGKLLERFKFNSDRWLNVRYEDLATDPGKVLASICGFIGLKYDLSLIDLDHSEYIGLGGNRMRTKALHKITLDDAWQRELTRKQRFAFAATGGWLNLVNGYSPRF